MRNCVLDTWTMNDHLTIVAPVLLWLLTVDDQSEEVGGRGGAVWLVPGLSLLRSQLRSNAQIPISEQFNIPHPAVSRQIVSLPRAGMLVGDDPLNTLAMPFSVSISR